MPIDTIPFPLPEHRTLRSQPGSGTGQRSLPAYPIEQRIRCVGALLVLACFGLPLALHAQNDIRVIGTEHAPTAIGPYSQALVSGDFVFVSGQIGLDPETGALVPGGIRAETRRALENMRAILRAAGTEMDRVVTCTVFLANLDDYSAMNEEYATFFQSHPPSRSTVSVTALPKHARVEINCIASHGKRHSDGREE
jgi:2-iminobutanoate/2-iminopropanoate deaminase